MHRKSILRLVAGDPKRLPIGALERFVLSQVPGHATAEDVAEATGLELSELFRVARHLVDVGALSVDGERSKTKRPTVAPQKRKLATTLPPPRKGARASLVPPTVVPAPRKHAELRSLGIGPREGFVLSQIDGMTSVADLGEITGLSPADLGSALRALEAAGVVNLDPAKCRPSMSGTQSTIPKAPRRAAASVAPVLAASPAAPPASESEACEISEADRARILEAAARLDLLDLYGVLGVEREADAKAIRRAYHSLAGQFHPDRHFGKKLGPLRKPLDRIFMRLTLAYDTLTKRDLRAAYDATLAPRPAKPAPSQKPRPSTRRPPAEKVPSVRVPARKSVRAAAPAGSAVQSRPVVAPVPAVASPAVVSAATPPKSSPIVPPAAAPPPRPGVARDRRVPQERALVFVRAAEEALDRHDFVGAANNYRLAVQCSDDPALRIALEQTDAKARVRVRETSLAAARTAEQSGRWADAGEKYAKANAAQPEPWVAERAANAIRLAGGDLRAAARLAEQAVLAEPTSAAYRVTLGEVYLDAGLLARAAGESARAIALAPNDARARGLAKLVAKGKRA